MPKLDVFHNAVKNALEKDGWTITHDPLRLEIGKRRMYVDLGAERLIAAEKNLRKIAVEVKSFVGKSDFKDLEDALGQYVLYQKVLNATDRERMLYLAVSEITFMGIFSEEIGQLILSDPNFHLLVFQEDTEEISQWIPSIIQI